MRTNVVKHLTDRGPAIIPGVSFLIQDELFASGEPLKPKVLSRLPCATSPAPKRDTKSKGDISELRVALALVKTGYAVSKPLGENQRYDLIADDGECLHRVQVKTGRVRGGVMMFNCCSTHGHRRTGDLATRAYTGQIEFLAVYCPENEKVYLIPESDLTRTKIQLRLVAPRNNMTKTIRWASRYELA
jgi:hypothetical protein